jgi:putative ABC transport system ATP-binding protein
MTTGQTVCEENSHPMIALKGVTKTYRLGGQSVRALNSVDLRLRSSEFVAVVGPSGAGKSTLLHILGALDTPDSGSVHFNGREITGLRERDRAELRLRHIGFVFQFFNLLPTMSAWENVALPKLLSGISLRAAKPEAVRLLAEVGLADHAARRPAEMSGGQLQRVAVARALITDPELVLADEPTGNLDSKTGAEVVSMLCDIAHDRSRPRSVIMVTHNVGVAGLADRVIQMHDGNIGDEAIAEPAAAGGAEGPGEPAP